MGWVLSIALAISAMCAESEIPLSSIVTTSRQEGLQHTQDAFRQNDEKYKTTNFFLEKIRAATNGGASNIFLVDATNAQDAVQASTRAIVAAGSADKPLTLNMPNPKRGSYWMVAYLGTGPSSPTYWTVEGVTVDQNRIRLSYRKTKSQILSADLHQYYYWIPLGKLESGDYELELFDADGGVVTLMRRVSITEKMK